MVLEKFVVSEVFTDLHVEVELETPLRGDLVEQSRDLLGLLMIRCHAGANQAVGNG